MKRGPWRRRRAGTRAQGFWVARLAAALGSDVVLCCALGGEPGRVLNGLIEVEPLTLRAADAGTPNGVYVHDRRSGQRIEVVSVDSRPLARHASDELYGIALGAGLDADLTLMTGCRHHNLVDADLYRRLIGDLRANGKVVIADLTGPPLRATLQGGVELLRLSDEQLVSERYAASDALPDLMAGARRLHAAGARQVLVSRAAAPAVLISDGDHPKELELVGPQFEALDKRGAGDSMFAATGVGLARGMGMIEALPGHGSRRPERHTPRPRNGHTPGDRTARGPCDGSPFAGHGGGTGLRRVTLRRSAQAWS